MMGNILDNTTELYMIKYTIGEIFSSGGATLYKNPSDQTVSKHTLDILHNQTGKAGSAFEPVALECPHNHQMLAEDAVAFGLVFYCPLMVFL